MVLNMWRHLKFPVRHIAPIANKTQANAIAANVTAGTSTWRTDTRLLLKPQEKQY